MMQIVRNTLMSGVVIASIWNATEAQAQQKPDSKPAPAVKADTVASSRDSVTVQDVQKAAEQLAIAVEAAVRKATEDPAVKVAALKVAKNAVTAAQVVITEQVTTLQAVLDALAKEIALATEKQQAKAKSH